MPRPKAPRTKCFYCDALITKNLSGDHFPVPLNAGGVAIVPCCVTCHDMKDRFNFDSWPQEWVDRIVTDFPKLNRETRLFLAKSLRLHAETIKDEHARTPLTGRHHVPRYYESKFAAFIQMCASLDQGTTVIVAAPEVLGDSYGEIVESLARLAKAGLTLGIAGESWHGTETFEPPRRESDFSFRRKTTKTLV